MKKSIIISKYLEKSGSTDTNTEHELEIRFGTKYGKLSKYPVEHNVYNKFIGIAAKKRKKQNKKIEEFLWLLDCRKIVKK